MHSRPTSLLSLVALLVLVSTLALQPQVVASPDQYYPTGYNLLGETAYISGELTDLQSDNGVYMAFRSYASQTSIQTLYAHQETTTIAGTSYYLSRLESADTVGISLFTSTTSTGRQPCGKFVYPLTGVTSIPTSTWTFYYRTWYSGVSEEVFTNSPSSIPAGMWSNPTYAYSSDNNYAYTSTPTATQQYGNYGFNLPANATVMKVEVGYEAYTDGNEKIGITCSWNGGTNWATEYESPNLGTTDPGTLTWVDFTADTSWTADKLSNANFRTQVEAIMELMPNDIYLDWIPVRVTYVLPPSVHADVDILIREAGGAIRQTIATDVANSGTLSTVAQTLSGTYSWPAYTVVNETDYLEIDYHLDVTTANPNATAHLRIDDDTLTIADQTRITGIMLPSEYTVEVEFTGSSDLDDWTQLDWTVDSAWTTGNVSVTLQLYNYTLDAYSPSGDGYIAYKSSATSNTDETKSQTIITNPTDFRDASGNWKIKIKSVKSTTSQFEFKADLIKYETPSAVYVRDVAVVSVTPSSTEVYVGQVVNISVIIRNEGNFTETFNVTLYYDSTAIGTQTVTDLEQGTETTLRFSWDTTDVTPEVSYTIKAEASGVTGETDTADNTYTYDTVKVKSQITSPPLDWRPILPYLIPILLGVLAFSVAGILRKKREVGQGFEFFNEMTDGGIPDAYSVMILGGAGSGKSVLCQQLAYNYLTQGKSCVYVTYDTFPFEVRQNMKNFGWDTSPYEQEGTFKFVDSYSGMAGLDSEEKYYVESPFSLSDLGITMSSAINELEHKSVGVSLDSTAPLFARVDPSKVTEFLQDRSVRIKGDKGAFFFTVGEGTVPSGLMRRLEEIVDCIIELDVYEKKGKTWKRMRVRKLRGRRVADAWVPFKIELKKGITFLPPKDWIKSRKS